jgi:hypothetical protein
VVCVGDAYVAREYAALTQRGSMPNAAVHIDGYAVDETPAVSLGENVADGRTAISDSKVSEMTIFTSN